jgi:hypothetical protein
MKTNEPRFLMLLKKLDENNKSTAEKITLIELKLNSILLRQTPEEEPAINKNRDHLEDFENKLAYQELLNAKLKNICDHLNEITD